MKANAVPLLALFEKKMRLEVPLFQRQYVWSRELQWEPLWEDIVGKFKEYLEGRKDAPVHFLGAMVLDLKQTPATHVEKRQVIDGQQRLTTLQIFLAAFRDLCRALEFDELAEEFDGFTINKGMMANPDVDKYKVWHTQADQGQFTDVIGLGSEKTIREKHPLVGQKRARKPAPRPRMVECYLYFSNEIFEFFLGTEGESPFAAEELPEVMEECFQALKSALQVVVIDLEQDDDAQVIFETLNARGATLLPADLLRNYIFLRAARLNEPQEELYKKYWRGFEEEFWRKEVRQGRLTRPRSDLFMQHFLASRKTVEIPVKHLFMEYRHWIERSDPVPFKNVAMELDTLSKQRDEFRRILEPRKGDVVFGLATFLNDFDISTAYPLLLFLFDVGLSDGDWKAVSTTLESYLVRRAVLGWTTKNYNKIFLKLTKELRQSGPTPQTLITLLSELEGDSAAWPRVDVFLEAWLTGPAYGMLNNARLVHILRRVSDSYLDKRNERITIDGALTIEHLLPQDWTEHWPLSSGVLGLTAHELRHADSEVPRVIATRTRETALQTIGNLTILVQALNSAVSNSAWPKKKLAILKSSLLPINQELHEYDKWDEKAIQKRGKKLFQRALNVWPGPA
jgi:hypothetical protein